MTLLGFKSRWMTYWPCRSWSAAATRAPIDATSSKWSGASGRRARRDWPPMYSVTMYGWTEKSPDATKRGTCGPESVGRIICSTSNPTMAAESSKSRRRGTFHGERRGLTHARHAPDARHGKSRAARAGSFHQ